MDTILSIGFPAYCKLCDCFAVFCVHVSWCVRSGEKILCNWGSRNVGFRTEDYASSIDHLLIQNFIHWKLPNGLNLLFKSCLSSWSVGFQSLVGEMLCIYKMMGMVMAVTVFHKNSFTYDNSLTRRNNAEETVTFNLGAFARTSRL